MRLLYCLFIAILVFPVIHASYYADVSFDVAETGFISVSGSTNHPNLTATHDFTSKSGPVWTLDVSLPDFEVFVYEIMLPRHAVVSYVRVPNLVAIEERQGRVTIRGSGRNQDLTAKVQYTIEPQKQHSSFILLGSIIVFLIIASSYFMLKKYQKTHLKTLPHDIPLDSLTERQQAIMKIVIAKGSVTQSYLQKELGYPKAALSRNIESLRQRDLIEKFPKGMTNYIQVKQKKTFE